MIENINSDKNEIMSKAGFNPSQIVLGLILAVFSAILTYIGTYRIYLLQGREDRLNAMVNEANSYYSIGDYDAAYRLYFNLSEEGVAAARSNLGVMYENGLGTAKDTEIALDYYLDAYHNGCKKALYNYVALSIKEQTNREELIKIFSSGYENHDLALMECAAACMKKNVYYAEPYEGEGFKYKFENIDKYFPTFPCEKLKPVEDIIISTPYQLSEYENETGSRHLEKIESSLEGCIYTYRERRNTWPFLEMLDTGIAGNI